MAEDQSQPTYQILGAPPTIDDGSMDDLLDKLKLLGYDQNFCRANNNNFKLLTRGYFATQSDNSNTQFFYFTSLTSWLMNLAGHRGFPPPGQFDDPNAVSTNILQELKAMDVPAARDIAPTRLRQGQGEAVLAILCSLADRALQSQQFQFNPNIEYPTGAGDNVTEIDVGGGGDALGGDDLDDRVAADTDSDDEVYVGPQAAAARRRRGENDGGTEMIKPQVTAEQWALEVERVGPKLQYKSDEIGDWRARVESAGVLLKAVEKMYPDVKTMLERMGNDLSKAIDRIQKREQTLAQQFHAHVEEYRSKLTELNSTQDSYNQAAQQVSSLSMELAQVTEQLDQVKKQIEDREQKSSDTTPLMKIKDAVTKVKSEIREMSLRIGVLQHTVLHYALRQQKAKRERLEGGRGNSNADDSYTQQEQGNDFSGYF